MVHMLHSFGLSRSTLLLLGLMEAMPKLHGNPQACFVRAISMAMSYNPPTGRSQRRGRAARQLMYLALWIEPREFRRGCHDHTSGKPVALTDSHDDRRNALDSYRSRIGIPKGKNLMANQKHILCPSALIKWFVVGRRSPF